MSLSNYAETLALNTIFSGALFLALYTTDPTDADSGTEVSGGGYARQPLTGTVAGDTFSADDVIEFPPATANWGTVTHVGICDASTGGHLLASAALASARTVTSDDVFREDALTVTLD